jgi:hypothetical protein
MIESIATQLIAQGFLLLDGIVNNYGFTHKADKL